MCTIKSFDNSINNIILNSFLDSPRDNLTDVSVRLVGGKNIREGRLQVYKDDQWGTVCNFGWTIESAALACQQMGWVLNPEDWNLMPSEIPATGKGGSIRGGRSLPPKFNSKFLKI